ncbi:hypothetical protein ACC732_15685 [Rhizobium ruizarguesonis]
MSALVFRDLQAYVAILVKASSDATPPDPVKLIGPCFSGSWRPIRDSRQQEINCNSPINSAFCADAFNGVLLNG